MSDVPILMYHDVSSISNPWCVSPQEFEQQMAFLYKHGYKTISLSQLGRTDKCVVLTFDDARKGVFATAFPILKKYNFTATVFVVPSWIDGGAPETERYTEFMSWNELSILQAS